MLSQYLVLHYLRKPLISMAEVWLDIFPSLDLVPINIWIATENAHLVFVMAFHVGFANSLVEPP